ncbi:MAG: hypothetical protein AMXMBFR34_08110 [Myxococcaceae bacterium]
MSANDKLKSADGLVVLTDEAKPGRAVIPAGSPLARLNYYDGKFLRAADMDLEQRYLMSLVALSNQGLGAGVVYGYGTSLSGEFLELGAGLAIDPQGHPLFLPAAVKLRLQEIIDASRRATLKDDGTKKKKNGVATFSDCVDVVAPPETGVLPESDLYIIAICRAEALCGVEDVFGARCESACATSTERPLRREGVVVRAIPLQLRTPFPTSTLVSGDLYLRSKVARSWFADEVLRHPNLLSREGLTSGPWCLGATWDASCCEVPLAIVSRGAEPFLDAWSVRRERMDAPSRRYWQWRMRQRPWDVFLAQVLQFQCQLAQVLGRAEAGGASAEVLDEAMSVFENLRKSPDAASLHPRLMVSSTMLSRLLKGLEQVKGRRKVAALGQRVLLSKGIIELPPAGYLPVLPGELVNEQVRALLGEGVDLRFCAVRHDYVGHAFDEARDLDRISLYEGLEDPANKPKVDVLVPDGVIVGEREAGGGLFRADIVASAAETGGLKYRGVAREGGLAGGGSRLVLGAAGVSELVVKKLVALATPYVKKAEAVKPFTLTPTLEKNAFVRKPLDSVAEARIAANVAMRAKRYMARGAPEETAATAAPGVSISTNVGALKPLGDDRGDGLWLEVSSSLQLESMAQGERSDVTLRTTLATFSTRPTSIDVELHGQLVATQVTPALGGQPRQLKALVSGVVTMSVSIDNPPSEQELFMTLVQRGSLPITLTFEQGVTELSIAQSANLELVLRREAPAGPLDVRYVLGLRDPASGQRLDLSELQLVADSTVTRTTHPNHALAEHALTIVQASRLVIDPTFLDVARPLLFPALAATDDGLAIQAVLDWVMFHRRREKQCTPTVDRPVELPPRKYRVMEITARTAETLKESLSLVQRAGTGDVQALRELVQRAKAEDKLPVFAEFDGGSAHGRFNDADLGTDWTYLTPGSEIRGVAWGAVNENLFVETGRLDAVEHAIAATSQPAANEVRAHLDGVPADVQQLIGTDALMVFVTMTPAVATTIGVLKLQEESSEGEKMLLDALTSEDAARVALALQRLAARNLGDVKLVNHASPDGSLANVTSQFTQKDLTYPFILWTKKGGGVPEADLKADGKVIEQAVRAKSSLASPTGTQHFVQTTMAPTFQNAVHEHLLIVMRARQVLYLVGERVNGVLRIAEHTSSAPAVHGASRVTLMVPRAPTAGDRHRVEAVRELLRSSVSANTASSAVKLPAEVNRYIKAAGLDAEHFSDVVLIEK